MLRSSDTAHHESTSALRCVGRQTRALFIAFCLSTLVIVSSAAAETYLVYGIPFQLESVATVDSTSVKVSIRGETRIIPKSERNLFIVKTALADPIVSREFNNSALADLTENALKAGDERVAAASYLALTQRADAAESLFEGLVINLLRQPGFEGFAVEVLSKLELSAPIPGVFRLVVESPVAVLEAIRGGSRMFFEQRARELQETLRKYYLSILTTRAYATAEKVWITASTLYPDSEALQGFRQEREIVSDILLASRNLDLPRLIEIRHSPVLQANKALARVLTDGLHNLARQSLYKRRYREAFQIIANVDVNQVTPATHEIAMETLKQGIVDGIEIGEILVDLPVALMLRSLASSNAGLLAIYVRTLEEYVLASPSAANSDLAISEVLRLRPDPNAANDSLRYQLAIKRILVGDRNGALQLLASVAAPLSFIQRTRLLMLGLYVPVYLLYPGVLLVLVLVVLGLLKRRAARLLGEQAEARRVVERAGGFKGAIDPRSELRLEYLGLLRAFSLGPEASIKDIKAVYRTRVKEHHPDSAGGEQVSEEFLVMNERYQRLLELYEILDKPDDVSS